MKSEERRGKTKSEEKHHRMKRNETGDGVNALILNLIVGINFKGGRLSSLVSPNRTLNVFRVDVVKASYAL